ncbi:MAG TPA: beta-phosphoglucomutase [Chryseolinea sp.]|nr:beta-phosphoglucomutase [Chryseolinea sp.]
MIKACIFDLDGVIVDTANYHYLAWKRLANELGFDLSIDDNEKLKGVSRMHSLEIILNLGGVSLNDHDKEVLANKKNGWFVDYLERMAPDEIFPGVKSLLIKLRNRGIKIALASSSKNAMTVVKLLHIQNEFDVIVDGTMTVNSKPDPEIFLLAAKKLGLDPKDCIVFEDAEAGVEAALAAGMRCIGVGSPDQLGKANKVISTTGDFQPEELATL